MLLGAFLFLSACQTEIYSSLSERDANEMMAVLLEGGVQASKVAGKEGLSLQVDNSDVQRALEILSSNGLPEVRESPSGKCLPSPELCLPPSKNACVMFMRYQKK